MTTRAVKTLTKMKAKNVVDELRSAGLTPFHFWRGGRGSFLSEFEPPDLAMLRAGRRGDARGVDFHHSSSSRSMGPPPEVDSEAEDDPEPGMGVDPARLKGRGPARGRPRNARRGPTTTTTRRRLCRNQMSRRFSACG